MIKKDFIIDFANSFNSDKCQGLFSKLNETFKPSDEILSDYIPEDNNWVNTLKKIGSIDFKDEISLWVISAELSIQLSERSSRLKQYKIAKRIIKEEFLDSCIFIFYDKFGSFRMSLVSVQYSGTSREYNSFKRQTFHVSLSQPNKTFINQIFNADFSSLKGIKKAFSIEAVSDAFYKEFKPKFDMLAKAVSGKKISKEAREDFALLFAIRIIFLGFVQRKGWLGIEDFISKFWEEYKVSFEGYDKFYDNWLKPLFFEALNNPPGRKVRYGNNNFSTETEKLLQQAPYLNGDLFKPKKDVDLYDLYLPDKEIKEFIEFLFQYNFTIEENANYDDEELELNPEFLGIIFERLVNKADGAVYTPRVEVDFMCRISLLKWLQKNGDFQASDLYNLFFRNKGAEAVFDSHQKQGDFSTEELDRLIYLLENVTICDPAAGSGAFEVGMLHVLNEIIANLKSRPNYSGKTDILDTFHRKERIIARSLYGVEVKRWAVWINQLRLWLTLFIDMPDDLKNSTTPLLPSLNFKVVQGDSLIQRIGNKPFPVHGHAQLSSSVKSKITALKKAKIEFFDNKGLSFDKIKKLERDTFTAILDDQIDEKRSLLRGLAEPDAKQQNWLGEEEEQPHIKINEEHRKELQSEIDQLMFEKNNLTEEIPFIWNIEFPEIFFEKGGFDIIIGNPPYVRQEDIKDPQNKLKPTEYKAALKEMVIDDFRKHFVISTVNNPEIRKINGKSDLYIYFYLRSLHLLNSQGIHCFICENTWLDVEYGIWFQEFLLANVHVPLIIDNHVKRSFSSSDVNTIISIMNPPKSEHKIINIQLIYKFISFFKPFEEVLFSENLLEIEQQTKYFFKNKSFRSYPITISNLIAQGCDFENEENRKLNIGIYIGDKWGRKYLKAPDIFFDIIKKGTNKFLKLKEIGKVKYGTKTGYNKFFYLSKSDLDRWDIEEEYLRPVLKSPTECETYLITHESFKYHVFYCDKSKSDLNGTNALKYINYGENLDITISQGSDKGKNIIGVQNLKSVKGRKPWYRISENEGNTFWNKELRQRLFCSFTKTNALADCRLYYGNFSAKVQLYLNSTLYHFIEEVLNREIGGGGGPRSVMVYEVNNSLVLNPDVLEFEKLELNREIKSIFIECGINPDSEIPIEEQEPNPLSDRKELDNIVFDALGLTEDERNEVYRAVCRLVWNRISKARSV
ncbi:MAG: Eco57I restriction-modification methylase domain-containing protein [Candidatus Atribacteria bacterium]|nr:Eco57I restriction-modification methylase domain-containing protein [Candidatus Atribacteria bacterium]